MSFNSPGRGFLLSRQPLSGIESGNCSATSRSCGSRCIAKGERQRDEGALRAGPPLVEDGRAGGRLRWPGRLRESQADATAQHRWSSAASSRSAERRTRSSTVPRLGRVVRRVRQRRQPLLPLRRLPGGDGLFDVHRCCAALYLKQGSSRALSMGMPDHPTHDYRTTDGNITP